jgi:hypothetical protein
MERYLCEWVNRWGRVKKKILKRKRSEIKEMEQMDRGKQVDRWEQMDRCEWLDRCE